MNVDKMDKQNVDRLPSQEYKDCSLLGAEASRQ